MARLDAHRYGTARLKGMRYGGEQLRARPLRFTQPFVLRERRKNGDTRRIVQGATENLLTRSNLVVERRAYPERTAEVANGTVGRSRYL